MRYCFCFHLLNENAAELTFKNYIHHERLNSWRYKSTISLFTLCQNKLRQTETSQTQSEDFLSPEKEISEVRNFFCRLWKQHPKPGFLYGHPKETADRHTQWRFHRKGRKVERNVYLEGSKKFTVYWVFKRQTPGGRYLKTHPSALCLQCGRTSLLWNT